MNKKRLIIYYVLATAAVLLIPASVLAVARYCAWMVGVPLADEAAIFVVTIGAILGVLAAAVVVIDA